jgi:hypothetical protein
LAIGSVSFADDALVLPKGVLRTYVVTAFVFTTGEYDDTGEYTAYESEDGALQAFNLGAAVEYGVIDWISAAVQWAPGYTIWSSLDLPAPDDLQKINGAFGIFAGAKVQLVGENAVFNSDMFRFALAPGVKIPMPMPDWKKQGENAAAGKDYINPQYYLLLTKPAFAAGARVYFDFIVHKMFYINLYGEFMKYFDRTMDLLEFAQATGYPGSKYEIETMFNYQYLAEIEPHFEMMLGEGLQLKIGAPVRYSFSPEYDAIEKTDLFGDTPMTMDKSYSLTVGPNVSLFLRTFVIPLEIKVGYTLPLMGESTLAQHTVSMQIKAYMKF